MPSKRLTVCAAGVATAVVLAGCGSSSPGGTPRASGSTPSTSASISPGPTGGKPSTSPISATPLPSDGEDTAALEAGRYVTSDPFTVPVEITVPAGWISEEPGPYAVFLSTADGEGNDGPAVLTLLLSPIAFSDPCKAEDPGSSVASLTDFAKAVTAMRGTKVTGPTDVTAGGLKGRQVTLSVPAQSVSCKGGTGVVMTLALGHQFSLSPGESMSLTALDDSGVLLIVEEKTTPQATPQDRAQLAEVL
jgi:hypothetical protein